MSTSNKHLLSTSYRDHLPVAIFLGAWLYLFLTLIAPFDAADLTLAIRVQLMIGYGLIFAMMYTLCVFLQNALYRWLKYWNSYLEMGFLLFFSVICLPPTYRYYITDWVRGDYGFPRFTLEIYLPILLILLPAIALARRFVARRRTALEKGSSDVPVIITITGNNKLDVLRLRPEQLIAVSAANNYVTVYYQENDRLKKKLLRAALKKVHEQLPMLVRVHRSHLIHPLHFRAWRDAATLELTHLDIPVTPSYKTNLLERPEFGPSQS